MRKHLSTLLPHDTRDWEIASGIFLVFVGLFELLAHYLELEVDVEMHHIVSASEDFWYNTYWIFGLFQIWGATAYYGRRLIERFCSSLIAANIWLSSAIATPHFDMGVIAGLAMALVGFYAFIINFSRFSKTLEDH